MFKFFSIGFIIFILSIGATELSGALNYNSPFNLNSSFQNRIIQKEGFVKGRITQFTSNAPVCFADIIYSYKTLYSKSNLRGEFILGPLEFPATLTIRKFGFTEKTVIINKPVDSVLISLTPLEVHKSYSGNNKHLQYELIFKKALEKFRSEYDSESKDHSQMKLVYCRFSASIDSTVNSLFESYAQMNVSKSGFQDYQPYISRYASTNDIPGLTGYKLDFNIDPYVNLPIFAERYITRKGYFLNEGKQIAMVTVDLGKTRNTYYINVTDTSIIHITSQFKQDKRLEVVARINDTLSVRKTFSIEKYFKGSMGFFVPVSLSCPFVDIRLILSDKAVISEQLLSIPLKSGITLQFFPESGKMVDGINTVIAYKALDNKGYPTEFNADITDENNNAIKHISGDNSGVGKFEFTPEYNRTYKALVNLAGTKYSFNLPGVEPKGYILNFNSDSSDILIKNNQNNVKCRHYLLISVRGAVYATIETILDDKPLKIHLPLKLYPKGIVQITLFDSLFRPLAERLVFNNRSDQKMYINIETDKKVYRQRDKINLTLKVTDAAGNPVRSSLSLAVVDASKSDSLINSPDIESYLYLTSELKGVIDFKLLNLSDSTSDGNTKRDLVMMTQGWRNYLWNSIRYTNILKVLYPIEKGFCIDGTIFNFNNRRSCSGYKLNYFDFKSGFNGVTEVDENNKFEIDIPLFYNSHVYFIQNMNNKDKIGNLSFILDTFPLPDISYRKNELPYKSYNAGYLKALDKKISEIDSANGPDIKYINLPEVKVIAKSDRSGYSAPDITINLDKKDPTGKKYSSLFQLIYEEFGEKAFTATGFATRGKIYNPILVVNGAPLTASECPPCYDFDAYGWAATIPVNEISDAKLYEAESKYSQWLTPPPTTKIEWKTDVMGNALYMLPAKPKIYLPVVSIKTYSNSYRGNPRGAIIFPFQGIYMAREFYQLDYENKNIQTPDNRTTIYWNPEIQTDSTGTAKVSFYNSDLKGKARIRISGVSFYLKDASTTLTHYLSN